MFDIVYFYSECKPLINMMKNTQNYIYVTIKHNHYVKDHYFSWRMHYFLIVLYALKTAKLWICSYDFCESNIMHVKANLKHFQQVC